MNFGIGILIAIGLVMYFTFELILFQIANAVCRIPSASPIRTIGVVLVLRAVTYVIDIIFGAALYEIYKFGGYPLWEAAIVQFLLTLPIEMVLFAIIHAKMMNQRFAQGISVWFVINFIRGVIALTLVAVVVLVLWAVVA